jgi:hypothetical protein
MVTYGPITTKYLHKPHPWWPFYTAWKILALPDKLLFPLLFLFLRKKCELICSYPDFINFLCLYKLPITAAYEYIDIREKFYVRRRLRI